MSKNTDWDAIKREYELDQVSNRVIATAHGITEGAIRKRAKKEGWTKGDLAKKARKTATDKLVREERPREVRKTDARGPSPKETAAAEGTRSTQMRTDEEPDTDADAVERAADRIVAVVRSHRKDIAMGRGLVARLMGELDATTSHLDEIENEIIDETLGDQSARRRNLMLKAISLPSRASTIQALSLAMTKLVGLERQAFNMDDKGGEGVGERVPLEDRLRKYDLDAAVDESGGKVVKMGTR